MRLEQREGGWWIVSQPHNCPDCGPYKNKAEAKEDLRGLANFYKENKAWLDGLPKAPVSKSA